MKRIGNIAYWLGFALLVLGCFTVGLGFVLMVWFGLDQDWDYGILGWQLYATGAVLGMGLGASLKWWGEDRR